MAFPSRTRRTTLKTKTPRPRLSRTGLPRTEIGDGDHALSPMQEQDTQDDEDAVGENCGGAVKWKRLAKWKKRPLPKMNRSAAGVPGPARRQATPERVERAEQTGENLPGCSCWTSLRR